MFLLHVLQRVFSHHRRLKWFEDKQVSIFMESIFIGFAYDI